MVLGGAPVVGGGGRARCWEEARRWEVGGWKDRVKVVKVVAGHGDFKTGSMGMNRRLWH